MIKFMPEVLVFGGNKSRNKNPSKRRFFQIYLLNRKLTTNNEVLRIGVSLVVINSVSG